MNKKCQGPFRVIDADTGDKLRRNGFFDPKKAFAYGYSMTAGTNRDFLVLDVFGNRIPHSAVSVKITQLVTVS